MKIAIMGCGRVGARLAQLMDSDGHQVTIIDADSAAFDRLPPTFGGRTVLGTGIDVDVLKAADIANVDAFAAVTNFDNTNIMACEVAKEIFGVEKVLARIYDPAREDLYHQLGLDTVCPTTLVATAARSILEAPGHADVQAVVTSGWANGQHEVAPTPQPARPNADGTVTMPSQEAVLPTQEQTVAANDKEQQNGRGLLGRFRH